MLWNPIIWSTSLCSPLLVSQLCISNFKTAVELESQFYFWTRFVIGKCIFYDDQCACWCTYCIIRSYVGQCLKNYLCQFMWSCSKVQILVPAQSVNLQTSLKKERKGWTWIVWKLWSFSWLLIAIEILKKLFGWKVGQFCDLYSMWQ